MLQLRVMAHRCQLPKVTTSEVRNGRWDLNAPDLLVPFLDSLPLDPLERERRLIPNKYHHAAELHVLKYAEAGAASLVLWHGTTWRFVPSILMEGFRESCIPGVHEFTTPGVYCGDHLACSLYNHAIATKFNCDSEVT